MVKRVVDTSATIDLDNYKDLEARAGVYIFMNIDGEVKYIGKAGAGRIVDEIYNAMYRKKDLGATTVKVLYTNSDLNALSLESELIDTYDPPNNLT